MTLVSWSSRPLLILPFDDSCSMIKFLVRALPHWLHFTPKPDIIPPIPSDQRPYVSTILGTNIFCILLHLVFNPPAAGEAMRGYLHGGLMIDFVGQSSPVSRWHLLGLDLMCLALQVLIMCVILEKQKVLGRLDATTNAPEQRQDHDAEEAGVIRSESLRPEAIELQSFGPQGEHIVQDHVTSTQTLGLDVGGIENRHVLDHFGTGEYVVAQFCVPDIMRTQWNIRKSDMISVPTTGAQNVAGIARRRFTATFRASTMVPGSP